ncbi:MAG: hypothetical protein K5650_00330 [Bacteroidales bacterium]|nr:hypothetical protein [Bacteroidales bacterium]
MKRRQKLLNKPWFIALLALLPVVLTYPVFEPDFGTGLDSSYVWGLNWLFDNDYSTLKHLIYPYGPLAFLKIPTAPNGHFAFALAFYTVVKWAFVVLMLRLVAKRGHGVLWALLLSLPVCAMGNIDSYTVGCVALLTLMVLEGGSLWLFAAAAILLAIALCIKSSFGLQCCSVLFVGWLLSMFQRHGWLRTVAMAFFTLIAMFAVGWAVYDNLSTATGAAEGMARLVEGYSAALVLEPEHQLWALLLFAAVVVLYPVLCRDRRSRWLYILLLVPLFANWKHGVVREDFFHFRQLLYFAVCMFMLIPLAQRHQRLLPWVASIVAVLSLGVNLRSLGSYPLTTSSPSNVVTSVFGYSRVVARSEAVIDSSLALRRLPTATLKAIGDATVDCYPWEHLYCAANNLNWQPHATLELGAGNSLWLNRKAATNFEGSAAVDFVLLHHADGSDIPGLRSLDGRYMLSDEPAVMEAIIVGYEPVDSGDYGLLLVRRDTPLNLQTTSNVAVNIAQDQWLKLPETDSATFLRLSVNNSNNIMGWLRSVIYKPDVCTIELMMADGSVTLYRYSPATAHGGLWLSPLPASTVELADMMSGGNRSARPVAVRLSFTHPRCHCDSLRVELQTLRRQLFNNTAPIQQQP